MQRERKQQTTCSELLHNASEHSVCLLVLCRCMCTRACSTSILSLQRAPVRCASHRIAVLQVPLHHSSISQARLLTAVHKLVFRRACVILPLIDCYHYAQDGLHEDRHPLYPAGMRNSSGSSS